MDTIHEDTQTIEAHESEEEVQPLTKEEKEQLAKAFAAIILVGTAAVYGTAVASYKAGRVVMRKVQEYRAKKKEESTN